MLDDILIKDSLARFKRLNLIKYLVLKITNLKNNEKFLRIQR